jgi:outer membrane receptor protein involved in Fe transport
MKSNRIALSAALLTSTALAPAAVFAQDTTTEPQISDQIIVRYQYIPDDKRVTSEVSSVLGIDDFETTGDDDLAAALVRVAGLSSTGGRFVIVRGLNERYSNTLLNGSPMPSPEPFRRAAPLDILPTNLLSGVNVQKTFSPQYPGEFGGGVVEIETATLPEEGFFSFKIGASGDTVTTFEDGLLYDGSDTDWLGYDDGLRDTPEPLAAIFDTTRVSNSLPSAQQQEIGRSLVNSELWVVQEGRVDANGELALNAGDRWDFDNFSLGVLAAFQYDNSWDTRRGQRGKTQIGANGLEYENGPPTLDRRGVADDPADGIENTFSTENTIDVSAMFSVGVDFYDDHEFSFLSMVLRSTSKEARIEELFQEGSNATLREDFTWWFERQVVFNQLSGSHIFENLGELAVDWRFSDATATRDAPYQRFVRYEYDETSERFRYEGDIKSNATNFSEIEDETQYFGIDFSLPVTLGALDVELKAGYAQTDRERGAFNRRFSFEQGSPGLPADLLFSRIDYIFAGQNIADNRLRLIEGGGALFPEAYDADLTIDAWYAGFDTQLGPYVRAAVGARFEDGEQNVRTFAFPARVGGAESLNTIQEDYVLPAATFTVTPFDNFQLRLGYSQSITRPQFRELAFAEFFNTETDQRFFGNPFLVNSEIESFDVRAEYYFGREQFVTLGFFSKEIENPIEEYIVPTGDLLNTSFINAPSAELTGWEFEFERTFDFSDRWNGEFFNDREWFIKTNYTYIDSEVSNAGEVIIAVGAGGNPVARPLDAELFIGSEARQLQGQSEHLFNAQVGFETFDGRARGALLYNFTGERIRSVADTSSDIPAIIEQPPASLDWVYSRTIEINDNDWDVGFSVRNILGDDYEATQSAGNVTLPVDTYEIGTSLSFSISRTW